jgi:hypothetical protein
MERGKEVKRTGRKMPGKHFLALLGKTRILRAKTLKTARQVHPQFG